MPGTGSLCVFAETNPAIRIARGHCPSTRGARTSRGDSAWSPGIPYKTHAIQKLFCASWSAEDNPVNQRLAVRMLEKRGHRVAVAGNGREALEALAKDTFDLVFMDVQMPEMDGIEATAAIRQREKGHCPASDCDCVDGARHERRS